MQAKEYILHPHRHTTLWSLSKTTKETHKTEETMRHLTKRPKPHVNRQFNQCGTRPQRHNKSHKDFKWPQKKRDEKQALEFLKTQNVSSELPKRLKAKQSKRFKVTKKTQNDAKRKKRIKKTHSVKTLPKRYKSEAQDHKEKLNNTKKPQRDFKRLETEYSLKTSPKISKRPKMQNYQRHKLSTKTEI